MGTFIVGAAVLCVAALTARYVFRKTKQGECIGCAGGCSCGKGEHSGCCHGQDTK